MSGSQSWLPAWGECKVGPLDSSCAAKGRPLYFCPGGDESACSGPKPIPTFDDWCPFNGINDFCFDELVWPVTTSASGMTQSVSQTDKTWKVVPGTEGMYFSAVTYYPKAQVMVAAGKASGIYVQTGLSEWTLVPSSAGYVFKDLTNYAFDLYAIDYYTTDSVGANQPNNVWKMDDAWNWSVFSTSASNYVYASIDGNNAALLVTIDYNNLTPGYESDVGVWRSAEGQFLFLAGARDLVGGDHHFLDVAITRGIEDTSTNQLMIFVVVADNQGIYYKELGPGGESPWALVPQSAGGSFRRITGSNNKTGGYVTGSSGEMYYVSPYYWANLAINGQGLIAAYIGGSAENLFARIEQ